MRRVRIQVRTDDHPVALRIERLGDRRRAQRIGFEVESARYVERRVGAYRVFGLAREDSDVAILSLFEHQLSVAGLSVVIFVD